MLITLDGKSLRPRDRFDRYCRYDRLSSFPIGWSLQDGIHRVVLEISPEQPDREVVVSKLRGTPKFDPSRFDGTNMWIGYIMMRGELVSE